MIIAIHKVFVGMFLMRMLLHVTKLIVWKIELMIVYLVDDCVSS